jgi:hypothetical protein
VATPPGVERGGTSGWGRNPIWEITGWGCFGVVISRGANEMVCIMRLWFITAHANN